MRLDRLNYPNSETPQLIPLQCEIIIEWLISIFSRLSVINTPLLTLDMIDIEERQEHAQTLDTMPVNEDVLQCPFPSCSDMPAFSTQCAWR